MSNDKQRTRQRAEWREQERCLDCGHDELANNKDGSQSRYCTTHLAIHSTAHRNKRRDSRSPEPPAKVDADGDLLDIRDGDEFKAYEDEIRAMFEEHKSLTRPEIHRMLKQPRNDYWTGMVLGLMNLIEHQQGLTIRYELYTPVERKGQWSSPAFHRKPQIAPPADRTRPAVESFPGGAA